MASLPLKKNYRCVPSLQQFYSGGPFAVSSDGSFIACKCGESIKIVDSLDASIRSTIEGDLDEVTALALSPDGNLLFSAGHSRQITIWDLSTLKCVRSCKDSESKCCLGLGIGHMGGIIAFSKKRKDFFVSGSSDHTLKVWSLDGLSGNAEKPVNLKAKAGVAAHDKDINSVAFAPNDSLVCSGSQDRTACVWRLPDLVPGVVLKGHKRGGLVCRVLTC